MAEIYQLPDSNSGNNGNSGLPFSIPIGGNNGGLFGNGNGWGGGVLGFLIGLMCGNNGGLGGMFGGGNGNAQMLANAQQYLMEAINHNGDRSTSAIQNLSAILGQDFNQLSQAVNIMQNSLFTIAANQGTNTQQIINSLQLGNQNILSQFQQCCCQNQLAIANQTNALQQTANQGFNGLTMGIGGLSRQIEAKSAADQLATCQLKYDLTDGANRNTQAILAKMDAIEDARKDREIVAKDAEIATLKSQNFIAGAIAQATAPINAQLVALNKEVDDIRCKQPNTVSVQYPNLVAMNATPYVSGGVYPNGYFGNGYNGFNF